MSINSLFTPSFVALDGSAQDQTQISPFDVEVSGGEFLDTEDIARRIVKLALGTTDEQKVDDFLQQSGFKLKDAPPRLSENGKSAYRFAPDEKFLKSIESFKKTGTAIRLNDAPKTGGNGEVRQTNAQTVARPQAPRTVHQPKPKQVFRAAPNTIASKKSEYTGVELDPKQFISVAKGKDGKLHATVLGDGDPREEILRAAMNKQFGAVYPADVIEAQLNGRGDGNSVYWRGTAEAQSKEQVINNLLAAAQNKTPYKFGINNGTRKELARLDIEMHGTEADKLQLKINDSLKAIDEKFDKIEPQNLLHQSLLAMQKESEKKAAIEALTAASNIDFRSNETNAEKFANQTADVIERTTRAYLEINPLYRYLPGSVKDQMVKGTVGFVRGGYSLYATAKGASDFVNDAVTDGVLSAFKTTGVGQSLGIEVDKAQAALQQKRGRDAEFVRAISSMGTAQMSQSETAFQTEKDKGLTIRPYDYPNWATKGGELTAKALPYIAIGIATGGVGSAVGAATESGALTMLAQMGTSAVGTGILGGAETYSQTRQYAPAIRAAGMSAAQGAVAPLTAKLGLGGDLAANTVYTVALGKIEGKSDGEIFQDAVLQNALGLSMAHGTKAYEAVSAKLGKSEFSQAEAQTALKQIFTEEVRSSANTQAQEAYRQIEVETVAEHLSQKGTLSDIRTPAISKIADLQARGNQLKTRFQTGKEQIIAEWGKNNKLVTRSEMQAARERISQKMRASLNQANIGADPSVLADFARLATGHLEAGARSLETFKTAIKTEAKIQKANLSDEQVAELFGKAAEENLTKVRGTLSKEAQAEFDALRTLIGDEKLLSRLPDDPAKVVKMFDGLAAASAKKAAEQANAPQRAIEQQAKLDAARVQLDQPNFIQRKSVQTAVADENTSDLSGYIGVELAKQKLATEYPAAKGYQIQEGVLLYKDSGYKTTVEWQTAHPGESKEGVVEMDGKAWQKLTDADLMVVKKNAAGKYEIAQVEQIKAGRKGRAGAAQEQLSITMDGLKKISVGDPSVRIVDKRADQANNITKNYDLKNLDQAKAIIRGADDRQNFDVTIGLTSNQIRQLAEEIIAKHQAKGGN